MPYKISSTYEYILNADSLGDNIQPPFLANVKAGDILIMEWNINDDDKITIDDGWTEIPNTDPSEGTHEVRAFYHVATADGEQCSSYSNTYAGNLYMHTKCIRVDGVWSFIDSASTKQTSASNTNVDYPALTATAQGQYVTYLCGSDADAILEGTHPNMRQISGVYGTNDSIAYEYVTTGAGVIPAFQDHVDSDQTTALGYIIGDEGGLPPLDIQPIKALAPITDITHNTQWMEDVYASGYDIDTGELRVAETPTLAVYAGTSYIFRLDGVSGDFQIGETITFSNGHTGVLERSEGVSKSSNWNIALSQMSHTTEADNTTLVGSISGVTARIRSVGTSYQINVTGLMMSDKKFDPYALYKWYGYAALGIPDGTIAWINKSGNSADTFNEGYSYKITSHASRFDLGTLFTLTASKATGTLNNYGMCHFDHDLSDNHYYTLGANGVTGWKKSLVGSVKTFDTPKDMSNELMAVWHKAQSNNTAYGYMLAIDTSNRWKLWKIRSKYVGGHIYTAIYHNLISMSSVNTPLFQVPNFDVSAIKKYGILFRESSDSARNGLYTYGQALIQKQTVTGGGATKQVAFNDIANLLKSEVSAEGIAYTESIQSIVPSQFMLSRDLVLSCNINMANQALSYPPQADGDKVLFFNVDGGVAGIEATNSSGNINTSLLATDKGGYYKSGANDNIDYSGTIFGKFDITLVSGKTYTGVTYTGCSQILQNGATLSNCNIKGNSANAGAILISGTISGGSIVDNLYGIEIASVGSYTLNDIIFSNNTYDINVTAVTGIVNITTNVAGLTYQTAGATVNILAPEITFTVIGLLAGSIVEIYDNEVVDNGNNNTKLGFDNNSGTSFDYPHAGISNDVRIQVIKDGYEEIIQDFTLSNVNQSLNIVQEIETN